MATKLKAQADSAKKAAALRAKEARKRADAAKAEQLAARTSNPSLARADEEERSHTRVGGGENRDHRVI
ncbi:hypothetical protein [Saccharopolyspora antimicrobica]|uniref:hypothetical protein n=1 Tax=Saccharopolyspora antimicrobica TaxID=455193 RepID=UPI0011609485|nr:hypothetical protein [Saccharopolyspora antimicrobica]